MRESTCRNFPRKNEKYPTNARVADGGGIFPINSVVSREEVDHKVLLLKCEPKNKW